MSRPTFVSIDEQAFCDNLQRVKAFAPQQKVIALVKANAYGHGVSHLNSSLDKADALGVCCIEEALDIRELGVTKPIVLMEGFFEAKELKIISEQNFQIVVHHAQQLEILQKEKIKKSIDVWLKIDTGMHRLGFSPQQIKPVFQQLNEIAFINKPIGLMTHFADADMMEKPTTLKQLDQFSTITRDLTGPKCLANSAAIIAYPQTHGDWIRPGIMLYGISPFENKTGLAFNLKPVMTLSSELITIHDCQKGDSIGYGGIYTCPEAMRVGVVAIGYGDGYPRHVKNGTPVLINNKQVPLVGRVSMDMMTVDLRSQPHAKIGDQAVLWGKGLPVETIAKSAETIPYELVCGINKRVHKQ